MNNFYQSTPDEQTQRLRGLAAEALKHWDIECLSLELIKYRENAVYRLVTTEGEEFAVRINRPGYHSEPALRSELQWIDALDRHGFDVPQVIPTTEAELLVTVSVSDVPEPRQVGLFSWVEGQPLAAELECSPEDKGKIRSIYRTVGQSAAKLHNQATSWPLPEGFQRHAWDLEGLVGEQPFWGRFWELESLTSEQRQLLIAARDQVRRDLRKLGQEPGLYSLIHADFVPDNLLVDGGCVRLIDFDDAGFGWHLFEIATALYFIQDEPYFDTARDAMIAGYRDHRPLSDEALEQLPLFLVARGCTYLGWVQSRQETETAKEMTSELIRMACDIAQRYMAE
ncbi:MAG: phosphotransferase [Halopseudomonas sp.]